MKRLRTVVLEGFKTFARTTIVDLADGLTAIVGPNGCGKSNFIDAIAWAVGSRSWKGLRASEMEDVLFYGAPEVAPAERALVRLVFDNSDRALPIDVEEVEVARELARGGGSKVWVNRVESTVKEVSSLLAGTGLVGGFSLVRQGSVDRLVLSSAEEVGKWVEEAAGVARFRGHKREALSRLERVRQHLGEAGRRERTLKREHAEIQARVVAARAKKDLEEKLVQARRALAQAERRELAADILAAEGNLRDLQAEETRIARERETLVTRRRALEELLAVAANLGGGEEHVRPSPPAETGITPETAREVVSRLRNVSTGLTASAEKLDQGGPAAWPWVRREVAQAVQDLQQAMNPRVERRDPPRAIVQTPPPTPPPALIELRQVSRLIEDNDGRRIRTAGEVAATQQELAHLRGRMATLPPEAPDEAGVPVVDADTARADVARLEADFVRLGPVDETAIVREAALSRELAAVQAAVKDLKETQGELLRFIERVDKAAATVFRDTLSRVGEGFQGHVERLFGGGRARLRLAPKEGEGEAVLDIHDEAAPPEVEVLVRLPGKGECALPLLSGGERSLAGLALVLALADASTEAGEKGGRLLILDEVDAALDEPNVRRFAKLLGGLAASHQILCVSHNRLTLREAERLVGVTSGTPPATSAVVVQDLPTAQPIALVGENSEGSPVST